MITTSDPREDRECVTLTTVDISGRDDAVAGPSGGATIAPDTDSAANDGDPDISTVVKVTDSLSSLGSDVVIKIEPSEWFGAWRTPYPPPSIS